MSDFRIDIPFERRPPRLKDLVNKYVMDNVWVRDTPFGPVTDSLKISEKFEISHKHILRAIDKCHLELSREPKFGLSKNLIENSYLSGPKRREYRKVDITEFGLALLLLYLNSSKARKISAEILFRFFILKTYLSGLNDRQIGAIKGYYRKRIESK